jgi:hypothetical protein
MALDRPRRKGKLSTRAYSRYGPSLRIGLHRRSLCRACGVASAWRILSCTIQADLGGKSATKAERRAERPREWKALKSEWKALN